MGEAPQGARCGLHPEVGAVAVCDRCGTFVCVECRREPREGIPCCASCATRLQTKGPVGLGGWLVLLCIGLVGNVGSNGWYVWTAIEIVASGGSLALGPQDVFDLASAVLLGLLAALALVFFFRRSRRFPLVATILLALVIVSTMTSGALSGTLAAAGDSWRGLIVPGLWIAYLQRSKRVEATFVR